MRNIIIRNYSKCDDKTAIKLAGSVVDLGQISGRGGKKQYCYATVFNSGYVVYARKSKTGSHIFEVLDDKEEPRV
jgi:hypothetical protein